MGLGARKEALVVARAQAQEADRLAQVGRLVAGVAHEVNNPLAFIQANLRFLEEELPREGRSQRDSLEALKETGKAAVGKLVLSSKEHLVLLRPAGDALAIELLFYPEDVRMSTRDEIEEIVHDTKVADAELDMAKQLVESLSRAFDPNEFENEHKRDLMALIEKKLAGEEITVAPEPDQRQPVPDLMAALQASLDQAKGEKRKGGGDKAKPSRAKKAPAKAANGAKKPKSRAKSKA